MASRRIEVEIIGSPASLKAALGASEAGLTSFERKANRIGSQMVTTGRTLTRNVTLPIVGVAAAATKMALDYDTAINHVQALTGASAKQTKEWSDQLLKLGPRIGQSPQQLAEALYFVASSGAKVNQVMPITAASAKLAAAGMGDAQTVAQLLTSAMNAYGSKALSAKKSSDILTEAIKVGKAEPAEFAQELGKVIPVAQNLGISFAEVAGITASLTNTGLDAATATTGLRNIMLKMMAPTKDSAKELKNVGLSVADLQNEVKNKGVIATLQDLNDRVDGNRQAMHRILPDARGLTAALALIGPNGDKAAAAVDKVENSTGAAAKAFRTAQAGPGQKFRRELAQIESTAVRVGNDLLPVVLDVLTAVGDLADKFDHLSEGEKHAIEIGLGVAALSGPLLAVGGNVVKLVGLYSRLNRAAGLGGAAKGIAQSGAAAETSAAAFNPLLAVAIGLAAAAYVSWKRDAKNAAGEAVAAKVVTGALATQHGALAESIREGGKSVVGWKVVMNQAHDTASRAAKTIQGELNWAYGNERKILQGGLKSTIANYVGQMRAVAAQARIASHDTADFGKSAREHYAHVAAMASATARLAAAMNSVPDQKYVSLVVSVTENLRTEALSPGMGPESTRTGPGGHYHPPTPGKTGEHKGAAHGGPLMAGRSYIVGERGPELITAGMTSTVTPNHRMGGGDGPYEIVIVNGEELRGYMRRSSRGAVAAHAAKNRQLERMGSDA